METPISWVYMIQLETDFGLSTKLDPVQQQYLDILEKTNQQLSLWWNPYGVMIGALGVLFAVLAIVAAVLLFRQSREFRVLLDTTVNEYRQILDGFISDKNAQIDLMKEQVSTELGEAKTALASATGEEQKRIAAVIDKLEKQQEALKPQPVPKFPPNLILSSIAKTITPNTVLSDWWAGGTTTVPCSNCGSVVSVIPLATLSGKTIRKGRCPQCNTVNNMQSD